MNDPADIVAAMASDIDRFGNQMGARTTRLAREAIADLKADLGDRSLGPWGVASKAAAMAQIQTGVDALVQRQAAVLVAGVPVVAAASQGRLKGLLSALDRRFLGAPAPVRFDTLAWLESNTAQLSRSRLQVFAGSFQRYGGAAVAEIEDALGKLALTGQPWTRARPQVYAAIRGVVGDRQWMVDRILRTETSAIYNGTTLAAMIEEDRPESPMLKRLIATFDKVTGRDSRAVHGQVRPVREPFSDGKRSYMAPPNRPHDREIVVPHRGAWGPDLPRLSKPPPVPAETSAPMLPPARSTPKPRRPALPSSTATASPGSRLPLAAAAVTLLAGKLQEQRRTIRARPALERSDLVPAELSLVRQLAQAQLALAGARLGADVDGGQGVRAGGLARGELLSAGGMQVRVLASRTSGGQVELVLAVGGARLTLSLPRAAVLPLRRASAPVIVARDDGPQALQLLASAVRVAVASGGLQRTQPAP